jgi:2-dehydro-3-deoxygalactonokinase
MTALIGLDWGTTNARALRFDAAGAVIALRERPLGILRVPGGDFAAAFAELVGDWRAAAPAAPVLMCGMIGSRQGWREARYAALPADGAALAAACIEVPGTGAWIVPGVSGDSLAGAPDVMRGEETQALGAAVLTGEGSSALCLPGSHAKWVEMREGRLTRFATFMTGEVFAALRGHTILGRMMEGDIHVPESFAAGLARARQPGGLLHHLFTVRTDGLFARLAPEAASSFLSGLLLGHEIDAAIARFPADRITIVGSAALAEPYRAAIVAAGRAARILPGERAVAAGLWHVARAVFGLPAPVKPD